MVNISGWEKYFLLPCVDVCSAISFVTTNEQGDYFCDNIWTTSSAGDIKRTGTLLENKCESTLTRYFVRQWFWSTSSNTHCRQLNPWRRVHPKELTFLQLFKKLYGTRRFITELRTASRLSVSRPIPIQSTPPSRALNIHFNIILPSTPRSSECSQISTLEVCSHHSSSPYVPHASPTSILISSPEYMTRSSDQVMRTSRYTKYT